jgi:hypothetical protein
VKSRFSVDYLLFEPDLSSINTYKLNKVGVFSERKVALECDRWFPYLQSEYNPSIIVMSLHEDACILEACITSRMFIYLFRNYKRRGFLVGGGSSKNSPMSRRKRCCFLRRPDHGVRSEFLPSLMGTAGTVGACR